MWALGMVLLAWAGPADEAFDALVEGRESKALQVLRRALDDDPDGSNRCLLGEVALEVGRTREAVDVLEDVSPDAPCAGRAAFVRAEALRRSGRLEEASASYQALTEDLSHPDEHPLSVRLEAWAQRLLDADPPDRTTATALLALAVRVEEEGSERRLALARRLAELGPGGAEAQLVITELSAAIAAAEGDGAQDRLRVAPLLGARGALELLRPLPDDPSTMSTRVRSVANGDLAVRYELALALVNAHTTPEANEIRREVGLELARAGWLEEARGLLDLFSDDQEVAWALVRLAVRAGDADAVDQIDDLLARFPAAAFRSEAESLRQELVLDGLRRAAADGRFDADGWDRVADQPSLALEAAWATDDVEDRSARLDALVARWPWSPEAREALRHRALDEGLDWLRERTEQGPAADVLQELLEAEIGIRTPEDAGSATVELMTRGLDEVELRLHRIDVEGWLRAGGRPGSLGDLDVSIVAPDRTWTVPVPDGGVERRFTTEVPVPGPGLYAVTAATTDREARTLLLVSDARVLARAQGPDLAMVALRDGEPVRGARFWVQSAGQVVAVRPDREGLARVELQEAPAVVVAQTAGGPALLQVGTSFDAEGEDPVQTAIDLDRPVYRPGDVVRFRAVATRGGEPAQGDWKITLVGRSGSYQTVRGAADRAGAIEGELVVPWTSTGRRSHGADRHELVIRALVPGRDGAVELATIPVIDEVPGARRLEMEPDGDGVVVHVVDADGVPVGNQPVQLVVEDGVERVERTDERGRIRLAGPPAGLPWSVSAALPDEADSLRTWLRPPPSSPEQRLRLDDPRARPGEPILVALEGEGDAQLRVVRLRPEVERGAPVAAPDPFVVPELSVFDGDAHFPSVGGLRETVSVQRVTLADGRVTLEGLAEGHYLLELVRPDGTAGTRTAALEVRGGTRVRLGDEPLVGRDAEVSVDGGWSLLTVEGGRMLDAVLVGPGRTQRIPVDRRWHGGVELVATSAEDAHGRRVDVDASLQVELAAERAGERWTVDGRVTDAAGNPQRARVVVRAVDELLIDEIGVPPTLSTHMLERPTYWEASTARAWRIEHGGWAEMLSDELLAEARREEEDRRKRLAAEGRLAESRVSDVLDTEVPLGVGGLGASGVGYGSGGGAFGSKGRGGVGVRRGEAVTLGSRGYTLYGARDEGLWRVVDTDKDGRFTVDAAAPDGRRRWRVEAIAVVPGSVGRAEVVVEPQVRPWFAVDPLLAASLGDVANPRARVVNPGEEPVTVQLQAGSLDREITIDPGAVAEVDLGDLPAGTRRTALLRVDGQLVQEQEVVFPLAEGAPGDGALTVAVEGRRGGTVVGALALMDDPELLDDPAHGVAAGRAALVALPTLTEGEQAVARQRIRAAVAVARDRIADLELRDRAQALRLVAEAAPMLDLPRQVVEQVAQSVSLEPRTPRERLELAFARAVADVPVQEATIGRLVRDVDLLDEEGRGMLARLLDRVDTKVPASLAPGRGVQWALRAADKRGRVDGSAVLDVVPPPLGAPERADWVGAVALALGDAPGTAESGPGWVRTASPVSAPLAWTEAAPAGEAEARAVRRPAGLSGRVAVVSMASSGHGAEKALRCGDAASPCRIGVGEAVATWDDADPMGGLRVAHGSRLLEATTPGRYTVWSPRDDVGWSALHVEVVTDEARSPLGQGERLAVASQLRRIDEPFADLIAEGSLEAWRPQLRGQAAVLRFAAADADDAPSWIAAFEDLRDEVPSASILRDDVVRTAGAYQRMGRHERALQVYELAIGQLFLVEAATVSEAGTLVGELAGLQALRELTLRYPAVPVVRESEFALPDRLLGMVGNIPEKARQRGVTDTELRLMAGAWDRRFVALAPDGSPLAPEAGLRLATGLMELGAQERALAWVQRLQRAHPDHELTDRWMLLEALLLTELGQSARAEGLLDRLSEREVPLGGGRLGPSSLRVDARLALARLAEAERRWEDAARRYQQVADTFPEASLAAGALTHVGLELDERLVTHGTAQTSRLLVRASNVDEVQIRAYAIDLRTLFLRESGLPDPATVRIDGLRPAWSGTRRLGTGPFPDDRTLDLPLQGSGAWLVRLDADGASTLGWVLRSDLDVHHVDLGGQRRLTARLRGQPVADARVRAVTAGGITAATTDVRGVAVVGEQARALVQSGPHAALTEDVVPGTVGAQGAFGAPRPAAPSLLQRVQGREEERRQKRRQQYDYIGTEASEAVEAQSL